MTKFRPAVLTDAGQSLATQAETGQIKLTFTKGVLSSDDLSQLGQTAIQQTSSLNPFITCTISASNTISANKVGLPLNFSNEQMTQDNLAKTVGVYASDGTTEYLYALCINDAPLLISAYNGSTPEALEIEFRTEVGRASTVNVTVSPMDTASKEQLSVVASQAGSAVSSNASQISNNSSAIAGLQTQINTNNTGLWNEVNNTINPSVASNSSAIAGLQTSVGNISSAVANNSAINAEFSIANSNIATNSSNISTNKNSIVALQSSAGSLSSNFSSIDNGLIIKNQINTGDDLNNYTTPGTYWCNFFVPINSPSQFVGNIFPRFKLVVSSPVNGVAHQLLYLLDGAGTQGLPNLYVRATYSGNSWNQWQAIADNGSLVALQSNLASTYQNAVNTAKAYTDSKATVTMTLNEADAINQAKSASSAGLFLYPTQDDLSSIQSYKHVLGIYSYGAGNLPQTIGINVINLDTSDFTFNNVYGIYNTSTQVITLHGTIQFQSITPSVNLFSINISSLNMNKISISWLNFQALTIDTDFQRQNIIGVTNASSGSTINLEGCTINLGYDSTLQPKAPDLSQLVYQHLDMGMTGGSLVNTITGLNYNTNHCLELYVYNSGDSTSTSPIEMDLPGIQSVGWNGQAMTLDFYNVNYNGVNYQAFTNNGASWIRFATGKTWNSWQQITQAQFNSYVKTSN